MILEYLWIKDFRVLKGVGFNFSSENTFFYNKNTKLLTVNENPKHIPNFFGPQISAVSAIIGKNGVGKSTLLEFIIRNLASFGNGSSLEYDDDEFIAVFSNLIFMSSSALIINIKDFEKAGYIIINNREDITFTNILSSGYENLKYIYYSNVFDYRKLYENPPNLIDLSTNHLLIEDSRTANNETKLYNYVYSEIKRQIDFLSEINFDVPFKVPQDLYIEISSNVYKYKLLIDYDQLIKAGLKNIAKLRIEENPQDPHLNIKIQLYINLIKYRAFINPSLYQDLTSDLLLQLFRENFSKISILKSKQQSEFNLIQAVFTKYDKLLSEEKFAIEVTDKQTILQYKIANENSLFYSLLNSLNDLMNIDYFLSFSWHSISSGEKAFLSMLARLNHAKKTWKQEDENVFEVRDLIIIIDEFDLYMHPEWQREFFNKLNAVLPKIFLDQHIQLILSSHSPFLVSDLPKSNIIFLDKENSLTFSIDPDKMEETFGQNIHTLYSNSFFLKKGLIGDFAKGKINSLIDKINLLKPSDKLLNNSETAEDPNRSNILKTIEIIGEPVIKNKLLKEYFKNCEVDDEILYLRNRIEELKDKKLKKE